MHNNAVVQLIMIWLMKKNPIDRNWIILHYLSQVSISTSVNHCFYLLGFSLMIRIFRSNMVWTVRVSFLMSVGLKNIHAQCQSKIRKKNATSQIT